MILLAKSLLCTEEQSSGLLAALTVTECETRKSGGRIVKDEFIPNEKGEHLANMPDARLLRWLYKRNALAQCV